MQFNENDPPRVFHVGASGEITLLDTGRITLDTNEQVTFVTESGTEFDVVRKSWGYYATPSLNRRLAKFNLRAVLASGVGGETFFVLLIERGKEEEFHNYLAHSGMRVVCWLDSDEALVNLVTQMQTGSNSNKEI